MTLQREDRLPAGSRLPGAVAERLRSDTLAELGYRSAIGRTLERTRAAAVGADREALERACRGAHLRIREQFGGLRDLYFYAEPLAMLAGRLEPPGVFLNAPAALERQLTAFCLDGWAATGLPEDAVPRTVRHVLDNVEQARLTGFPYPFLDLVQRRGDDLLETFFDALAGELTEQSRDYLAAFLQGDAGFQGDDESKLSLRFRMLNRFYEIAKERKALRADIDSLGRRIQNLKRAPTDEANRAETRRLTRKRGGLQGLLRKLNGRETFNFLTDEGLIPNYAFPEAGVTLKSVIYRARERDEDDAGAGEQDDEREVYEYVRPAASALSELAPENEFYAGGNRVSIDRIDLRVSPIETWRLCPSCDHCARVDTGDDHVACPRCGDVMWSDAGQRRETLPLRMVHAATSDRRARILDERDDREPCSIPASSRRTSNPATSSGRMPWSARTRRSASSTSSRRRSAR